MNKKTVIITNEMVKKYVSVEDVIESVENVWKWYGEQRVIMPPKITTDMSKLGVKGWFNSMPSYIGPLDTAGIKVVGGYDDNPKKGLPFIRSNILVTDPNDGFLKALVPALLDFFESKGFETIYSPFINREGAESMVKICESYGSKIRLFSLAPKGQRE